MAGFGWISLKQQQKMSSVFLNCLAVTYKYPCLVMGQIHDNLNFVGLIYYVFMWIDIKWLIQMVNPEI